MTPLLRLLRRTPLVSLDSQGITALSGDLLAWEEVAEVVQEKRLWNVFLVVVPADSAKKQIDIPANGYPGPVVDLVDDVLTRWGKTTEVIQTEGD